MPITEELEETEGVERELETERKRLLRQIEHFMELPMVVLGFVWLVLLVLELTLRQKNDTLIHLSTGIWVIFVLDFLVKFTIAPRKLAFVRKNSLTIVALALPALRVFRIARVLRILRFGRAARGVQLVRLISSFNRGMKSLRRTMRRRSAGYIAALTVIVVTLGALGMHVFERSGPASADFATYWESLWWTVMVVITMGTGAWPETPEGRVLAVLLALYGFGIFGYVTAVLASFFVGRDEEEGDAASMAAIAELRREIQQLRAELKPSAENPHP